MHAVTSLQGNFLIAVPGMTDDNFTHAVVLMLQHDAKGATGLIINRPLSVSVSDAMSDIVEEASKIESPLFNGGPCEGPIFSLHDRKDVEAQDVVDRVRLSIERQAIRRLLRKPTPRLRLITGYAGWGPMQLEDELAQEGWLIVPATMDDVFGDADQLWSRLVARAQLLRFVRPDLIPPDSSVN